MRFDLPFLLGLTFLVGWSQTIFAQTQTLPIQTPAPGFSPESRRAMQEFRVLLPEAQSAQNALLRELARRDEVRVRPTYPENALFRWLDERVRAAQTATQKREAIQDFLLIARPLLRHENRAQRRRGLQSALKAKELADEDVGLRAEISSAFLAPYLLDSDARGVLATALLMDGLWPRYGRIITLEIQNAADVRAMHKAAQTGPSDVPPLQIEAGNALTVPFLKVLATVPGPRQGWAIYRLARLFREKKQTQQSLEWFRRLDWGDGAGIFKRLLPLYDPNAAPVGTQSSSDINPARDEKNSLQIDPFALMAWDKVKQLLPRDVSRAQIQFVDRLRAHAKTSDEKRAPIYTQWAEMLAATILSSEETGTQTRREAYDKADDANSDALSALLKVDGAENVYYFRSQADWKWLADAEVLFQLPHFEALSGVNYNHNSRYDAIKGVASRLVSAGDLPRALPALELWSAICYPGNHYGQALDKAMDVLEKNRRLEDALLCLEAIPLDSGMSGGRVWTAPRIRKSWSEMVLKADSSAVVTERETPELQKPKPPVEP
jgi:hypothetical protein